MAESGWWGLALALMSGAVACVLLIGLGPVVTDPRVPGVRKKLEDAASPILGAQGG